MKRFVERMDTSEGSILSASYDIMIMYPAKPFKVHF